MAGDSIIRIPAMAGRIVAVLGLARSGIRAAQALVASGARVWAWDDSAAARQVAGAAGVPLVDLHACDWAKPQALVLSPGIPHEFPQPHPVAALAKDRRCPIIGDIELMARAGLSARFIGITGTNGKSTTTALIGHILGEAGRHAEVGGNLGRPALDLPPLGADGFYVLELSSYQLELTESLALAVPVLLNITPDHLDRHGGLDGYVRAKRRIFLFQDKASRSVVGMDDEHCREIGSRLQSLNGPDSVIPISAATRVARGVHAVDGRLVDDSEGKGEAVLDLAEVLRLPGAHNWQNAAAAYAACRIVGLAPAEIVAGIRSYPGLAHRQELVVDVGGVRYVNDSKATNADAAAKALACYQPIYWILGGKPKETGLTGLEPFYPRIAHAFLIGEAAERFAAALAGQVAATQCGTLANAVAAAHRMAQAERREGAVVLLSPACASFDQFGNFEERGDAFRKLVINLTASAAGANGGPGGLPARRRAS